jgi:hypothetical protein
LELDVETQHNPQTGPGDPITGGSGDTQGKVVAKYFEDDYKDRVSTADILARRFGAPVEAARGSVAARHLQHKNLQNLRLYLGKPLTISNGLQTNRLHTADPIELRLITTALGAFRPRVAVGWYSSAWFRRETLP